MDVSNPESPQADALTDALFGELGELKDELKNAKHCPFDWNGWGIGVEADIVAPERRPGESIVAWRLGVRTIMDGYREK